MTTSTKTSLSEAIENYRQLLAHLQKVVDRHLSDITNDVLEGSPPKVSSVFGVRRATAIQTHLDAAKYSVNAALFYARDAKEDHDAD
jgi:hypothetical protein